AATRDPAAFAAASGRRGGGAPGPELASVPPSTGERKMGNRDDRARARAVMVERQLAGRGIHDAGVLQAMRRVPREMFVAEALREFAYDDTPLPIEAGQTISQPYIVGLMIQAAEIRPGDRVLEIGTGSGYAAAVLARIASHVHTV